MYVSKLLFVSLFHHHTGYLCDDLRFTIIILFPVVSNRVIYAIDRQEVLLKQ